MDFPAEIWDSVALNLPFLDVLALALSCKALHLQFASTVQSQQERLRDRFRLVTVQQGVWDPHKRDSSNSIGVALEFIFLRELHPSFIETIRCQEMAWPRRPRDYDWGAEVANVGNGAALRHKIESIPWIYEDERQTTFQAISASDEATALCLLIPSLENLTVLTTYCDSPLTHKFFGRIARDTPVRILPKLHQISGFTLNGEYGLRLRELAPYASLPSVRTVIAECTWSTKVEGDFDGWPSDLPHSKASRVVFIDGTVVKADIEKWAAGFAGPCVMTQNWRGVGGLEYPEGVRSPEWDTLHIVVQKGYARGATPCENRTVKIELVDDDPEERLQTPRDHGVDILPR